MAFNFGLLPVWGLLFIIGVFDAREHRIPNKLILILLFFLSISSLYNGDFNLFNNSLTDSLIAFSLFLFGGLILYFFNFMAAGDVKLLGCIGFLLGTGSLLNFTFWLGSVTVVVGTAYLLLNKQLIANISITSMSSESGERVFKNVSHMPFAPILVISLAMSTYCS
ncbi:prepilin peptidase [Acinetobacter venetianus]|uniref:prepilin peptidase n=1 Tax=Acinetobacter venetianus TaxID=52133 RepID=UPI003A904262